MPASNLSVVLAWLDGNACTSQHRNLSTDGDRLWSYQMEIGWKTKQSASPRLIPPSPSYTNMTNRHIHLAECQITNWLAEQLRNPDNDPAQP